MQVLLNPLKSMMGKYRQITIMVSNPTENLTTSKVLELIAVAAIIGVLMTVATQIVVVSAQKNGTAMQSSSGNQTMAHNSGNHTVQIGNATAPSSPQQPGQPRDQPGHHS
jgi:hypothetical protein